MRINIPVQIRVFVKIYRIQFIFSIVQIKGRILSLVTFNFLVISIYFHYFDAMEVVFQNNLLQ